MGKKLENMKEQEIWLAQLPEYMGYGLYSFPKAWDYFGGSCEKVELNKCFDSGFGGY